LHIVPIGIIPIDVETNTNTEPNMSTLDRASHFYRIGFRAAEANEPARTDLIPGTFAHHDYEDGYSAGFNQLYWDAVRDNAAHDAGRPWNRIVTL